MLTKRHRAFVTATNFIFVLTSSGCSLLNKAWDPPEPSHTPFTFVSPGGKECTPNRIEDLEGCLLRTNPKMSELEARDRARAMVRDWNPQNANPPPWCHYLHGIDREQRTERCSARWRLEDIKRYDARERDWSADGPPKPDIDPWINDDGSCRGPIRCTRSFRIHHPIVAQTIGLAAVTLAGWAFIELIKGHGHKGNSNNGGLCTANCPTPPDPAKCVAYYLETAQEQWFTGKPAGC